jgi:hypothetical protein
MQQQMSFLDTLCGKTSPERSVQTADGTSTPSSKRSAPSLTTELMFLDLRTGAGNLLGAYWETTSVLPGESSMRNTSESLSDAAESFLSEILQVDAPEKYSLSPKACLGILRRAEKRGKELPPMLRDALMEVVGSDGAEMIEDIEEDFNEDEDEEGSDDEE